jgi:DNA/RNA endonuclease G (NUC1)
MLWARPGNTNDCRNTNLGRRNAKCKSPNKGYEKPVPYNSKRYRSNAPKYSGSTCYDGTKRHIEIGCAGELHFKKLMEICFDDVRYTTLYVKATIVPPTAAYQRGSKRPYFIQDQHYPSWMALYDLYSIENQRGTIGHILGSSELGYAYINVNYFLSKGHLAAKADFVCDFQQSATFYYENVAPQWQTFNGGNWEALESSVRAYADRRKLDLVVYTGTYGVATLPDVNGIETELYLHVDRNNNKALPVPKLFWKAVYDPKSKAGVVFVGINNPYVTNPQGDYLICTDVCSKIYWVNWDQENIKKGYSYCCEVDDFRSKVKYLPQFTVSRLLI